MQNLFRITTSVDSIHQLTKGELVCLRYHDIFDFPLTMSEMIRWKASDFLYQNAPRRGVSVVYKNGYYFLEGKEGIVYKRSLRKRISERKMQIAIKASGYLSLLPTVKMVAVTGSLAMANSSEESDIDLMIVTTEGLLWTTRLLSLVLLAFTGIKVRKSGDTNQKDKLCMNIWLDEGDMKWRKNKNIYTAHEIAQVVPIVNKNHTYESFISENKWILKFWPYSIKSTKRVKQIKKRKIFLNFFRAIVENFAFKIQHAYMKSKITRETVTPTRALFHPQDWGKLVLSLLG